MWPFTGLSVRGGAGAEETLLHHVGYVSWYFLGLVWGALIIVWTVMVTSDLRPASVAHYTRGRIIPPWDVPFPAVTVCPHYETEHRVEAARESSEARYPPKRTDVKCDKDDPENSMMEDNFFGDMVHCKYKTLSKCGELFRETLTSSGKCYTFNDIQYWSDNSVLKNKNTPRADGWSPDEGYDQEHVKTGVPVRSNPMNGFASGLQLLVVNQNGTRNCSKLSSLKVQIHTPAQVPIMDRDYFVVPTNKQVTLGIEPYRIYTDKKMLEFPETRGCYFSDEKKLAFFSIYRQANCQLECLANYTLEKCRCVPSYLPRDAATNVCDHSMKSCYTQAKETLEDSRLTKNSKNLYLPECDCKKDCSIDKYRAEYALWDYYWTEMVKINNVSSLLMLTVYIKGQEFIDEHMLDVENHPLHGFGDFVFILSCLTFLLLIAVTTSLANIRAETESTCRPLQTVKREYQEEI